jgi:hypothetical protein
VRAEIGIVRGGAWAGPVGAPWTWASAGARSSPETHTKLTATPAV